MSTREMNKTKLSKGILEMKFMKKTKEKVEKQLYDEEGREYFGSNLSGYIKKGTGRFIFEPSFAFCEGLIDGRVSFRGMNPEIERLMELETEKSKPKEKQETDVTDEQMASKYSSTAINMMAKKFRTKREQSNPTDDGEEPWKKKSKFLKPSD